MKVIDLLNKIANEEDVPKYIKVYNDIYEYDDFNKLYWNSNNKQLLDVYNGSILDFKVEIIEEKKIPEKLEIYKITDETISGLRKSINILNEDIVSKINEIIDYLKEKENK